MFALLTVFYFLIYTNLVIVKAFSPPPLDLFYGKEGSNHTIEKFSNISSTHAQVAKTELHRISRKFMSQMQAVDILSLSRYSDFSRRLKRIAKMRSFAQLFIFQKRILYQSILHKLKDFNRNKTLDSSLTRIQKGPEDTNQGEERVYIYRDWSITLCRSSNVKNKTKTFCN